MIRVVFPRINHMHVFVLVWGKGTVWKGKGKGNDSSITIL